MTDDSELFRRAMADVRPLVHDRVPTRPRPPAPRAVQTEAEERQVLRDSLSDPVDPADLETGEELLYHRDGVQPRLMRKLRRGQLVVQAELDLHGLTVVDARLALADFLARSRSHGLRCVRIVHGKGNRSPDRLPVLKVHVNHWLRQREEVLAFSSARPVDGGTGALYVLLSRR